MRLILFLFVIISSCTVQRRVHLKGWHVQWNKKLSSNKQPIEDSTKVKLKSEKTPILKNQVKREIDPVQSELTQVEQDENVVEYEDSPTQISNNHIIDSETKVNSEIEESELQHSKKIQSKPESDVIWFIVFIFFIGLFAIGIAIFLGFVAANATSVSAIILALIGTIGIGLYGLFLLLVGVGAVLWWS